jgi:predicted helicase
MISDQCVAANKTVGGGNSFQFPLYLYPIAKANLFDADEPTDAPGGRRPNLAEEFVEDFGGRLGMEFVPDGKGDRRRTFGPEDVFDYMYAVFHAPSYRTRYAEFLKIDFPRLPLTSDPELFRSLCALGSELVGLHLMERQGPPLAGFPVRGDDTVEAGRYTAPGQGADEGRVWINKEQYFEGVPEEVWAFHVGGYQVCQKWLKDRKGRVLTYEELNHYRQIVSALAETIRLMAGIDQTIEEHGGWPLVATTP